MKRILSTLALVAAFGIASLDADAARRFGGGSNVGKQRATPTQKEATPAQPASPAPNQAAAAKPATPAAAPAAAAAKPSFMSRWGGLLAGLGIGALLASLFGAQMGPIIGMILAVLLGVAAIALLFKLFANRNGARPAMAGAAPEAGERPRFAGIGSGVRNEPTMNFEPNAAQGTGAAVAPAARSAIALPPDVELQPFLRVAKTSFIRLQAANDAGDLSDIRDFTSPEVYAEVAMQVKERGGAPQKTEVVNVEAQLVDFATEDGHDIVSVRFYGLIRENDSANPEAFDEIWHVRRKAGDRKDAWLISGIQQNA